MLRLFRLKARLIAALLVPLLALAMGPMAHAGVGTKDEATVSATDHCADMPMSHPAADDSTDSRADVPGCCEGLSICATPIIAGGTKDADPAPRAEAPVFMTPDDLKGLFDPGLILPPPRQPQN